MRLYIADEQKLTKFDLPKKVEESFLISYKPVASSKELSISIDSVDETWQLKSNGLINIIQNGSIVLESTIQDYSCHELEISNNKKIIKLYSLPSSEENYFDVSLFNAKQVTLGNNNSCNIVYQNQAISNNHIIIKENKGKYFLIANNPGVYLNNKTVTQSYLKMGDIIFIEGLRLVYMGNFIRINNPNNQVMVNGMQTYSDLTNMDNTAYDKTDGTESEIELYKDDEYFYHTPRIRNFLSLEKVEIDGPPAMENNMNLPFMLAMGGSFTMGCTSLITVYTTLREVQTGNETMERAWPQLAICFIMLIGSVMLPVITEMWNKRNLKKREKKRQEKYGKYLDGKEEEIKKILENQSNILRENYPNVEKCYQIISKKDPRLWERKMSDEDFLSVRLGSGNVAAKIDIEAPRKGFDLDDDNLKQRAIEIATSMKYLSDVPVVTNLVEKRISAIIADDIYKTNYVNNLILQLTTMHSALDLKIVFLTDNERFNYIKYMPHLWSEDKSVRLYASDLVGMKDVSTYLEKELKNRQTNYKEAKKNASSDDELDSMGDKPKYLLSSSYYLIITDCYKKVKNLNIVKEILNSQIDFGFSMLIIENSLKDLPIECQNFIYAKKEGSYSVESFEDNNLIKKFNLELKTNYDMDYIALYLANIPISAKQGESELPKSLSFLEMYNVAKIEQLNILNRWNTNDPTVSLKVPIGVHADRDLFMIDLHEKVHGPHGLIAGSTGSGKSEFIITFVLSMAINYHPYEVQFVLIDYKGGGLAGAFENREKGISIPHLAGTITNLDTSEMNRTLVSINSELKRRQAEFNKARDALGEGTVDIYKYQRFYREGKVKDPISHLFIISDEFAELKSQQPDFMDELISTARIGRSLGVHLILATQKPSGVVDDQIWANSKFKICLKVQDRDDSMEMIRRPDAAKIKETGRFYLQVGYDEYFDIGQSGWAGARYLPSDKIIREIDDSIVFINDLGMPYKEINDEEETKTETVENLGEQLPNIVRYMVDLSKKEDIKTKLLWLSSIPDKIYVEGLKVKYNYAPQPYYINPVIGEFDNPSKQYQGILTLDLTNVGNTLIYGMTGSGKENLLTTMIYDICTNHSPDEVNLYIVDLGAEVLKMFTKFPHVGGVATVDDVDMFTNLFEMMYDEISKRKELFTDYGGSYAKYIKESGEKLPLIIIIINGYDVLSESFARIEDYIFSLIKEGAKYGIVIVATSAVNTGVSGRVSQMFMNTITLQQKQDDVYSDLITCPRTLVPKRFFGRGIVAKDKTGYEFQTAYFCDPDKIGETVRKAGKELSEKYTSRAVKIKTLPKYVTLDLMQQETTDLSHVAIGINKATLNPVFYNFDGVPCTMILTNRIFDNMTFVNSFTELLSGIENVKVFVIDTTGLFTKNIDNVILYNSNYDAVLKNVIIEVNKENVETTKKVFIFLGIGILKSMLQDAGLKLYDLLFENASRFKKSKFIFIDDYKPFQELEIENWYSSLVNETSGIWLGNDPDMQNAINLASITNEQREDESPYSAFTCGARGVIAFKHMVENEESDKNERQ